MAHLETLNGVTFLIANYSKLFDENYNFLVRNLTRASLPHPSFLDHMFSWGNTMSFVNIVIAVCSLSFALISIHSINNKWPHMMVFWPLLCISVAVTDDPLLAILFSFGMTELIHSIGIREFIHTFKLQIHTAKDSAAIAEEEEEEEEEEEGGTAKAAAKSRMAE